MLVLVVRRLSGNIIPSVINGIDNNGSFSLIFHFNFHMISNSNGIGRSDIIYLEFTFYPGIENFTLFCFHHVPATGGFIYECFQRRLFIGL